MVKFKKGDIVFVPPNPKMPENHPGFIPDMFQYITQEGEIIKKYTVNGVDERNGWVTLEIPFLWHPDWLEFVKRFKEKEVKAEDREKIFKELDETFSG